MDKKEIEKIILQAVGNPESGLLKENSSSMAQALFTALNPEVKSKPKKEAQEISESTNQETELIVKEERVIEPAETR
jgi:hypothetical protein